MKRSIRTVGGNAIGTWAKRPAWRRLGEVAGLAAALFLLAGAPAQALSLNPVFFNGDGVLGFTATQVANAGLSVAYTATNGEGQQILSVGITPSDDLLINPGTLTPVQDPTTPTLATPFVGDAQWTITNQSEQTFYNPLMIFTTVDPTGTYPNISIGLDASDFSILKTLGATPDFFAAVKLPVLAPGDSALVPVRYVIGGPLPVDSTGNAYLLPPMSLSGITEYNVVPEPGTALLLASGAMVLLGVRRWRS